MPLKVLMFGWELPPFNSGGLGVACYGLSEALASLGVEITFVLPKRVDIHPQFMNLVFADIPDFSEKISAYVRIHSGSMHLPLELYQAVLAYSEAAKNIASAGNYDLIHAHDWLCFPAGVAAARVSSLPFIAHVHATEFDRSGGLSANPAIYVLEKKGMDKATKIIALSNFLKNILIRHYQEPEGKISIVHNGINSEEFFQTPPGDPFIPFKNAGFKIVSYIGRLTLQKGVDYLIKSAAQVIRLNPKVIFIIIGSGDMEYQLITQVARLGISDHVLFASFLRGNLLKQVFRSSDIFIMPSVSEPFGLTALESISAGTPVLVSKQSGVSEAIHHVLRTDFWDVDEMTNQILSLLSHPALHHALSSNAGREVKGITWQKAAAKTIQVYREVLDKR